jgi:Zn ribbon nucleic-acid-binding protein
MACPTCKGEKFVTAWIETTVRVEDSDVAVTRVEYTARAVCPTCNGTGQAAVAEEAP